MSSAQLFRDAKLGDVGDVFSYTGAQDYAHQGSPAGLAEHPGVRGIEDSAAGKANNVMQEAERAMERTILIVDPGINVANVGLVD